ncbi:MAG TPA: rhodanese-like domain-containing protein, partial [Rubrivivax sp.]|nr:rhodanese-like domain-containing protein [Rubrivivax sp.]
MTDAEGDSASAGLTIQCNALRVQLLKDSPRDSRIPLGGKASFTAQAFVGERPVTEPLFFVWERNPDVLFGDPRNPTYETRGNGQSRQTATFNRPGTVPVWVNVLKEVEGRKMTGLENRTLDALRAVPDFPNARTLLDTKEVKNLVDNEGAIFVDLRYPGEFAQRHIPGAINITMRTAT